MRCCLSSGPVIEGRRREQFANGIPVWLFELALPIGFTVIAIRILNQSWSGGNCV
jgi:TRAP-type C4-dicarboxylate transport system permease small subunit